MKTRLIYLSLVLFILLMPGTVAAKTYFISTNGSDTNYGTQNSPFRTISKGAELAVAGDTVYVLEGVYRERVSPPRGGSSGNPIVYLAEKNRNVIIKGSEIWKPEWKKNTSNVYYSVPADSLFNDDCYKDNKNPFKVASSSTPYGREGRAEVVNFGFPGDTTIAYTLGQVFVNGIMYIQKPFLSEMKAELNTWFYDANTGNLYIHFPSDNPNNYSVEITTRRRIFAPHKRRLGYINVEGFVMEHCGNQYPANFWEASHPEWQQAGALGTRSGHHWIIRNNMVRFANGIGIDFGNEGTSSADIEVGSNGTATGSAYHIIDSNYICDNGAAGTAAYLPANITFTNNVIERNVNLMFTGNKRWESAGVKMHGPRNSLIANNLLRNNYMAINMYFDQGAGPGTQMCNNLMIGCDRGFFLEIGVGAENKLIIDNNIIMAKKYGISTRNSGGISVLHNLILGSTVWGISDFIDKTRLGCTSDYQYYYNNVLLKCAGLIDAYPPDSYNVDPYFYKSSDRRYDFNLYQAGAADKKFKIETVSSVPLSGWQTKWNQYNNSLNYDLNSKLISSTTYSIDTSNLTMQLNVDNAYLSSHSFALANMDKDYLGNTLNNDGTALPGPFQNLKLGANQIDLWNGLRPLDIYVYPYPFETVRAQTITFNALPAKTFGNSAFTLSATSSSGLPVVYSSSNPSVAQISGNIVTIIGAGTARIVATQPGNDNYYPAAYVTQTLVVNKASQSIVFPEVSTKKTGIADYDPGATTSSDLPITYSSSNTWVATIVDGKIHIEGLGYAAITASQEGNSNYNAAAPVTQHLYVDRINMNKAATASNVYKNSSEYSPEMALDGDMTTRWATDDSEATAWIEIDLGASYAITKASYCEFASRVTGFNVEYWNGFIWQTAYTGTTIGTTMKSNLFSEVIGSKVRLNITSVSGTSGPTIWEFAVYGTPKKASQTITFDNLAERTYGLSTTFDLNATSSSGLPVSYTSSNTDVATITGNTVTVVGVGATTITASQGGSLNYNAASAVEQIQIINASKPYSANAIPGIIEAENYDYGLEGYAYHDATPTNTGGAYRNDGVDLAVCGDVGGGYQIQTTADGEWVKYTVDVATSGNYVISTRCRAGSTGSNFRIEVDGVDKTGSLTAPNTNYGAWNNVADTIYLTAGQHVIRVYIIANIIHFNKFTFTSVSALKSMPLTGIVSPESADSYLTLSPNPLSGNSLTILYNLTVESNVRVAIYNLAGTVIYKTNLGERTAGEKNETLLLPSLPKGTYMVRIVTANGSRTEKLIHL